MESEQENNILGLKKPASYRLLWLVAGIAIFGGFMGYAFHLNHKLKFKEAISQFENYGKKARIKKPRKYRRYLKKKAKRIKKIEKTEQNGKPQQKETL